ncbi:MAG: hypothetical protein ABSF67_22615, partial [Roseiarcus sp.]
MNARAEFQEVSVAVEEKPFDFITIAKPNRVMGKDLACENGVWSTTKGSAAADTVDVKEFPIKSEDDILDAIFRAGQLPGHVFILGKLKAKFDGAAIDPRKAPRGQDYYADVAQYRLMLDFDKLPPPEGLDLDDVEACAKYARSLSPAECREAACCFNL